MQGALQIDGPSRDLTPSPFRAPIQLELRWPGDCDSEWHGSGTWREEIRQEVSEDSASKMQGEDFLARMRSGLKGAELS